MDVLNAALRNTVLKDLKQTVFAFHRFQAQLLN
jgi:hypothetical protein